MEAEAPGTLCGWPACRRSSLFSFLPRGRRQSAPQAVWGRARAGTGTPGNTSCCYLSLRSLSLWFATWMPRCVSAPAGRGGQSPGAPGWGFSRAGCAWLPALVLGRARCPSPLAGQPEAPEEQIGERGESGVGTAIHMGTGPGFPMHGPLGLQRHARASPVLQQRQPGPLPAGTRQPATVGLPGWRFMDG